MIEPPQFPLEKLPPEEYTPCAYNAGELRTLNQFRIAYEREFDRERRILMVREDILPAIFTYWEKNEKPNLNVADVKIELVRKLMMHIRNNWRRHHSVKVNAAGRVIVRKHDLVRELWPENVDNELRTLMKLKEAEDPATHKKFFQLLNVGISRARRNLTPVQNEELQHMWMRRSLEGHPACKQRQIFEKRGRRKIAQGASTHFLTMGALTVTFFAGKDQKNKWVFNIHDTMAKDMGVATPAFVRMFSAQCHEMQTNFIAYVRNLDNLKNPSGIPQPTDVVARHDLQIVITEDGFPTMPAPHPTHFVNKRQLADILRRYLNKHYSMASGGKYGSSPYRRISNELATFVDKRYLPSGIIFQDPTHMSRPEILSIIDHIRKRQIAHGIPDAFRWKTYLCGDDVKDALYTGTEAAAREQADQRAANARGRRACIKQAAQAKKKLSKDLESREDDDDSDEDEDGGDAASTGSHDTDTTNTSSASSAHSSSDEWDPEQDDQPEDNFLKIIDQHAYEQMQALDPTLDLPPMDISADIPEYQVLPQMWDEYLRNRAAVHAAPENSMPQKSQQTTDATAVKMPSKKPTQQLVPEDAEVYEEPPQKHRKRHAPDKAAAEDEPQKKPLKHCARNDAAAAQEPPQKRTKRHQTDDAVSGKEPPQKPTKRRAPDDAVSAKEPPQKPTKRRAPDDAASAKEPLQKRTKRGAVDDAASAKEPPQKRIQHQVTNDAATTREPPQKRKQPPLKRHSVNHATSHTPPKKRGKVAEDTREPLEIRERNRICDGIGDKRVRKVKVRID